MAGLAEGPTPLPQGLAVVNRARLDVTAPILKAVTGWIARHRRRPGARPWQRAATVHAQVVLVLRWLRHRGDVHTLARDIGVSEATGYRYLHEALDVIAAHARDLHEVLAAAHQAGTAYLSLDGTLIPTDRVAAAPRSTARRPTTCGSPASTTPSAAACRCSPTRPFSAVDLRGAARLDPRSDRRPG